MDVQTNVQFNMALYVAKIVTMFLYVPIKIRQFQKLFQSFKMKQVTHLQCESVFGLLCMSFVLLMSNLFSKSTILTSQSTVSSSIMQQVSSYSKSISHLLIGTVNQKSNLFPILQLINDTSQVSTHKPTLQSSFTSILTLLSKYLSSFLIFVTELQQLDCQVLLLDYLQKDLQVCKV